jgi:hypothetical protein
VPPLFQVLLHDVLANKEAKQHAQKPVSS